MLRSRFSWAPLIALAAWAMAPLNAAPAPQSSPVAASSPNAFGSVALPLGPNRFSERWRQAAAPGRSPQLLQLISPARSLDGPSQARFVNAALNRRIEFRSDKGDRWSTAGETLNRAAGDCEDYAIAKMQALKALGVSERDLFLTIGKDHAARQHHAVLLLRANGRFWVMDNRSDRLIPDSQFRDFMPIISFRADGKSWLHGFARRKFREAGMDERKSG